MEYLLKQLKGSNFEDFGKQLVFNPFLEDGF